MLVYQRVITWHRPKRWKKPSCYWDHWRVQLVLAALPVAVIHRPRRVLRAPKHHWRYDGITTRMAHDTYLSPAACQQSPTYLYIYIYICRYRISWYIYIYIYLSVRHYACIRIFGLSKNGGYPKSCTYWQEKLVMYQKVLGWSKHVQPM